MACGEDAKEGIIPEPDVPYDYSEFGGYHVKDTVGYDMATLEFYSSNDTAWIYAIKGQKVWFGMFNDNTKEQITEWKASSSEESDYTSSFLGNPFKVGDKYVCFMKIAPELYKPFLWLFRMILNLIMSIYQVLRMIKCGLVYTKMVNCEKNIRARMFMIEI